MAIKATKLADNPGGFPGDHAHYRLDKPIKDPRTEQLYEYIIVWSTNYGGYAKTVIVPAREDGSSPVLNELPGTIVGIEDHAGALWAAGGFAYGEPYEITGTHEGDE